VAAWLRRDAGMPVPQETILISSEASFSVPGKYMSRGSITPVGLLVFELYLFAADTGADKKTPINIRQAKSTKF
jgi:hypothetical protein